MTHFKGTSNGQGKSQDHFNIPQSKEEDKSDDAGPLPEKVAISEDDLGRPVDAPVHKSESFDDV